MGRILASGVIALWMLAGVHAAAPFSEAQEKALKALIHQEIKAALSQASGPLSETKIRGLVQDLIFKSFKHLQEGMGFAFMMAREAAAKEERQEGALKKHKGDLFADGKQPFLGQEKASKVAIVFTDPYCAHCHEAMDAFEVYISKHPQVKLIIHNYPLFGKSSQEAVRAFFAAHCQKKYLEFYKAFRALFDRHKKPLSKDQLLKLAKNLHLQMADFQKDMNGEGCKDLLKETVRWGKVFNITATPTFILQKRGKDQRGRVVEGMATPEECFGPLDSLK